jgi:hypothetical protein
MREPDPLVRWVRSRTVAKVDIEDLLIIRFANQETVTRDGIEKSLALTAVKMFVITNSMSAPASPRRLAHQALRGKPAIVLWWVEFPRVAPLVPGRPKIRVPGRTIVPLTNRVCTV